VNLKHLIPILLILIGVQIFASFLAIPVKATNVTAFGDPESIGNPFIYLGLVILMTAVMLFLFRFKLFKKGIKLFFLITVWATVFFVAETIVLQVYGNTNPIADGLVLILPIIAALLLWKYPEWYVIDTVGFVMCAGVTTIVGVSFGVYPIIILLAIFAIYDAISVYKTRHMIKLAESMLNQKLPSLFIIPKDRNFSYLNSKTWDNLDDVSERQTYIIGMGDIVFPSTMVVSSSVFLTGTKLFGLFTIPALGAMIGSCIGMVALQGYAAKHPQSHAGLPFLNAFTLAGFAIMYGVSLIGG
jgi:presenilin-like A22 family membrane protease